MPTTEAEATTEIDDDVNAYHCLNMTLETNVLAPAKIASLPTSSQRYSPRCEMWVFIFQIYEFQNTFPD